MFQGLQLEHMKFRGKIVFKRWKKDYTAREALKKKLNSFNLGLTFSKKFLKNVLSFLKLDHIWGKFGKFFFPIGGQKLFEKFSEKRKQGFFFTKMEASKLKS